MMTWLCVPLTADTVERMAADILAAASAGADMIELRLDYLRDRDDAAIERLMAAARAFPGEVIATCRLAEEGGRYEGAEDERLALMEKIAADGADYLDFEYEAWRRSADVQQRIGQVCKSNSEHKQARPNLILSKFHQLFW